jgi:hypothetical protein
MKSTPTLRFSAKRLFLLTLVCSVAVAMLVGVVASARRANRNARVRAAAANSKSGVNVAQNSSDKKQPLAPSAATITATLTDNIRAATKLAPGATINYTAVITNSGFRLNGCQPPVRYEMRSSVRCRMRPAPSCFEPNINGNSHPQLILRS